MPGKNTRRGALRGDPWGTRSEGHTTQKAFVAQEFGFGAGHWGQAESRRGTASSKRTSHKNNYLEKKNLFQQLESNKIAALSAKLQRIEEASRKKDEQTNQFITATRDALEQKMETVTEKREAYITDLKTKLKVI